MLKNNKTLSVSTFHFGKNKNLFYEFGSQVATSKKRTEMTNIIIEVYDYQHFD